MDNDPRDVLLNFVETGNVRDTEFEPIPQERALALRERLETIRADGVIDATGNPGDFAAALRDREAENEQAKNISRGKDVPRLMEEKPGFKQFYRAHDVISTLPAPGGLGLILLAILLFWMLILPATTNGETRTLLLWDVLLGKKKLPTIGKDTEGGAIIPGGGDGGDAPPGFGGNGGKNGGLPPIIGASATNGMSMQNWLSDLADSDLADSGRLIASSAAARGGLNV